MSLYNSLTLRGWRSVLKRGITGRYEVSNTSGERVAAFVPSPLPPDPPLRFEGALQRVLEPALLALGRLDGISTLLPDTSLFLYAYVRKEAVLSSQIEGTQSSLSDLLLFEMDEVPGAPLDDVREVSNYVAALTHGLERLRAGFPLCNRLIREVHAVLLSKGRGHEKDPGEFRRSQNWIGGTRPGNANFVPPPPHEVGVAMSAFERFLHGGIAPGGSPPVGDPPVGETLGGGDAERLEGAGPSASEADLPVLVRAGLAHVQFETIHPFLDGNGRVGRLLITLLLCHTGVLRTPLLYLSLYFKQNRNAYYRLLDTVRQDGDWEAWLVFFLEGVRQTAEGAVSTAGRLSALFQADRRTIESQGRKAGSALRVHDALKAQPIATLRNLEARTGISAPTASASMRLLVDHGIARELTGKRRNRIFVYDRYLDILNEGTAVG